jgi:hypothetical protein
MNHYLFWFSEDSKLAISVYSTNTHYYEGKAVSMLFIDRVDDAVKFNTHRIYFGEYNSAIQSPFKREFQFKKSNGFIP